MDFIYEKTYNIYMKDTVKEFASIEEFAKYFNDKLIEFKLTTESKKNSNENSVKNSIETAIGNHYVKIDDMFYESATYMALMFQLLDVSEPNYVEDEIIDDNYDNTEDEP